MRSLTLPETNITRPNPPSAAFPRGTQGKMPEHNQSTHFSYKAASRSSAVVKFKLMNHTEHTHKGSHMDDTLARLTARLNERGQTVTCAESCTGGLLSAELTKLSGSSAWFEAGFVTYSNEAKQQFLGVKDNTLAFYGAVSEETVREMALGALIAAKADFALSISGIAGPTGGSEEKPVGTVWFGLASKQRIWAKTALFSGDRNSIRAQAVQFALDFLCEKIEEA